jgi:hypothetical protein
VYVRKVDDAQAIKTKMIEARHRDDDVASRRVYTSSGNIDGTTYLHNPS